ncbi:hypothetical protein Sjap_024179 [Stephania japonica]|uniref:Uncharacterized protein n=1 Tax=Stephania japonica TaxID=461633 RepID=A0AAP0HNG6_9MAGN
MNTRVDRSEGEPQRISPMVEALEEMKNQISVFSLEMNIAFNALSRRFDELFFLHFGIVLPSMGEQQLEEPNNWKVQDPPNLVAYELILINVDPDLVATERVLNIGDTNSMASKVIRDATSIKEALHQLTNPLDLELSKELSTSGNPASSAMLVVDPPNPTPPIVTTMIGDGSSSMALALREDLQPKQENVSTVFFNLVRENGKTLPEFADAEEEELYDFLNLQLDGYLDVNRMRHYQVVYLIHACGRCWQCEVEY